MVAKSNRIRQLLAGPKKKPNDYIVGAYFETVDGRQCHVITYYVTMEIIDSTLRDLEACRKILENHGGCIDAAGLDSITKGGLGQIGVTAHLTKTAFAQIIRDVYYVARFDVKRHVEEQPERSLITITIQGVMYLRRWRC